jgi:hypothetical protein
MGAMDSGRGATLATDGAMVEPPGIMRPIAAFVYEMKEGLALDHSGATAPEFHRLLRSFQRLI